MTAGEIVEYILMIGGLLLVAWGLASPLAQVMGWG